MIPQKRLILYNVFFIVLIDNVVTELTVRFSAVMTFAENVAFKKIYPTICESELEKKTKRLINQYLSVHNDEDLGEEMQHLPVVHKANFRKPELKPLELELLNLLTEYKLCEYLQNVCIILRSLSTIPATVT